MKNLSLMMSVMIFAFLAAACAKTPPPVECEVVSLSPKNIMELSEKDYTNEWTDIFSGNIRLDPYNWATVTAKRFWWTMTKQKGIYSQFDKFGMDLVYKKIRENQGIKEEVPVYYIGMQIDKNCSDASRKLIDRFESKIFSGDIWRKVGHRRVLLQKPSFSDEQLAVMDEIAGKVAQRQKQVQTVWPAGAANRVMVPPPNMIFSFGCSNSRLNYGQDVNLDIHFFKVEELCSVDKPLDECPERNRMISFHKEYAFDASQFVGDMHAITHFVYPENEDACSGKAFIKRQ